MQLPRGLWVLLLGTVVTGCSYPTATDYYVPLKGTVQVVVTGLDTAGNTVRVSGATVNITPRAMPGTMNPGVNLVTDLNGETTPWTYDGFAAAVRRDGTVDPTRTVDIEVTLPGWNSSLAEWKFAADTLHADPRIAQQP